jgi:SAM-dependent methyltransferase
MYEVLEISLANVRRLYEYNQNSVFGSGLGIKGFDNPWVVSSHAWQKGEKVLDVGGAYSRLPIHLQQTYGCEVSVADDFGLNSNEPFWLRDKTPQEHFDAHPEIKFVLERLGDRKKSYLPENSFDVIYSVSVLEHVPGEMLAAVWQHMDALLKPGGEMIHAIDMDFPSNFGLSGMAKVLVMDWFFAVMPSSLRTKHFRISPLTYTRMAFRALHLPAPRTRALDPFNMALNPDIFTEGYQFGLNRIVNDKIHNYRYQREGSLLIRLRKKG